MNILVSELDKLNELGEMREGLNIYLELSIKETICVFTVKDF